MKGNQFPILLLILFVFFSESRAQTPEVLGGNLLNGAVTGTMLGAAAMGLQNTDSFASLRIGVGAGILGGAGIAVYDLVTLPRGEQLYISGVFNDGHNSSIIILLDTFYGVASGAVIGMAGMLVADRPIVEGLQYGASVGAWAGFGFGLVDAFFIGERNQNLISGIFQRDSLLMLHSDSYRLALIQPTIHMQPQVGVYELRTTVGPALDFVSFRMVF